MDVRENATNEKRLIDANALIKEANTDGAYGYVDSKQITDAPTIDAVEVVRCRDCIHYFSEVCLKIYSDGDVSQYAWQERNEDDFYSYGERKEGADNG